MTALLGEKGEPAWPHRGKRDPGPGKAVNPHELWGRCACGHRFSHGLPAPESPGMTWGPGLAAAGVGEEAVGGPGGRGGGASLTYHCLPCPERLRQGGARAKSG